MVRTPNSEAFRQGLYKGLMIGATVGFALGGYFGYEMGKRQTRDQATSVDFREVQTGGIFRRPIDSLLTTPEFVARISST